MLINNGITIPHNGKALLVTKIATETTTAVAIQVIAYAVEAFIYPSTPHETSVLLVIDSRFLW